MNYKIEVGENKAPVLLSIEVAGPRFTATVESPAMGRGTILGTVDGNKYAGSGNLVGHGVHITAETSKDGKTIKGHIRPDLFLLPGADFEGVLA